MRNNRLAVNWTRWSLCRVAVLAALSTGCATNQPAPRTFRGASPLEWSVRMANSEMARRDQLAWREDGKAKWDYTVGLFTLSLLKLYEHTHDPRYLQYTTNVIGSFITPDGDLHGYRAEEYSLDNLNPGKTVLALYELTKEDRYRKAAALLRRQLDSQPRTSEGGFWHKQKYPHQMWLDGLYMAEPFYAEYERLFSDSPTAFDDVAKQIRLVASHTYDPVTRLFYHGWDESKQQGWANKVTGTSPSFWGRAIGWYGMALVDTLDYFPQNHPARPEILATLRNLCDGILRYQDPPSGLWHQVVDQDHREGNYLEASASSMFVYTLAKGVNHGYLPRKYVPAILKAYEGLLNSLVVAASDGTVSLIHCCSVAGLSHDRNGTYEYYLSEPVVNNDLKGVGPFILAGLEIQALTDHHPAANR